MTIPHPAPAADATTRRTDLLEAVKGIEAFEYRQVLAVADSFNRSLRDSTLDTATLAALRRLRTLLAETDMPREDRHAEYLRVVRAVYAPYGAEDAARMTRTRREAVRRFRQSCAWERYGGMGQERDSDWELAAFLLVFVVLAAILGLGMQVKNAAQDKQVAEQEVQAK